MKTIWTHEALERLSEIEEFIAADNPENAVNFILFLIRRGESIADNPEIGRMVPELNRAEIREIIAKKYRIIYRLSGQCIEILTVFEGHKQLDLE